MEIQGTIIEVLESVTGEGANGTWTKLGYVLETGGQYPKKVAFDVWNEEIPKPVVGDSVKAQIDVESREYNGKWYTNVKAFAITVEGKGQATAQQPAANIDIPGGDDDLPFN